MCLSALLWAFMAPIMTVAIDNGIGLTPPMGWRSWNQFQCDIDQRLIEDTYQIIAKAKYPVITPDGGTKAMSLLELGYKTAGIDDCWQACGSGPGGQGFHDATGYPIVNKTLFPDMKAMTDAAKAVGVIPGWYGNNCHCKETVCKDRKCFEGDVKATIDFGFESIKLDGCGVERNVTLFAELLNQTGKPVMIENCHNGNPTYPESRDNCPFNFFRSSTDIRPTLGSILINLRTVQAYNAPKITGPGCWAYPDMLEVGVTNSQRESFPTLSYGEARSHFGAWCIVSAPLVLGMDLRDTAKLQEVWPIISNVEAIEVNQLYTGDSGVLVDESTDTVHFNNCSWFNNDGCDHPRWMVFRKMIGPKKSAFFIMNNGDQVATVSVVVNNGTGIECSSSSPCKVRDVWAHTDQQAEQQSNTLSVGVNPRDSAFVVVDGNPKY